MKYNCTFKGRKVGAIGVFSHFAVSVDAENAKAARLKLYETHEHLSELNIAPDDHERKSYTIIVASNGVDEITLFSIVRDAARGIATQVDNDKSIFDVDVIEGTFAEPLSGDTVVGYGRRDAMYGQSDVL